MNLTKEEIDGLDANVMDYNIPDAATETILRLIAYWKSQQPKVCRHCGHTWGMHENGTDQCPFNERTTTYEEAP